jgi:hypothetical protein
MDQIVNKETNDKLDKIHEGKDEYSQLEVIELIVRWYRGIPAGIDRGNVARLLSLLRVNYRRLTNANEYLSDLLGDVEEEEQRVEHERKRVKDEFIFNYIKKGKSVVSEGKKPSFAEAEKWAQTQMKEIDEKHAKAKGLNKKMWTKFRAVERVCASMGRDINYFESIMRSSGNMNEEEFQTFNDQLDLLNKEVKGWDQTMKDYVESRLKEMFSYVKIMLGVNEE